MTYPAFVAMTILLATGLAGAAGSKAASVTKPRPASACLAAAPDPYRIDLTPIDTVAVRARGHAQLQPVNSPFGIAVTPAGQHRYLLSMTLQQLPAPATLGAYTAYVAWLSTPLMDQTRSLGAVRNGTSALGEVSWNKFRVIVTAEASADVKARTGPVILRGVSPTSKLQPHDYSNIGIGPPC